MTTRLTVSLKRARLFETEEEALAVAATVHKSEVLFQTRQGFLVWSHPHMKWVAEDPTPRVKAVQS